MRLERPGIFEHLGVSESHAADIHERDDARITRHRQALAKLAGTGKDR
jgi:cyanophycinase-like exopeptidase